MSISASGAYPYSKVANRYLIFSAPHTYTTDIIGGFVSQESEQSEKLSLGTRVNIANYTISPTVTGKLRIRVHYKADTIASAPNGLTVYLNIDGSDVVTLNIDSVPTEYNLLIDHILDVTNNRSYSISIDVTANDSVFDGITLYVYIVVINGIGIDSTAEQRLLTYTNIPSYTLDKYGDFDVDVGIRCVIVYNRRTSNPFTLKINDSLPQNLDTSAKDDGDNTVTGYATVPYKAYVILSGKVGGSGDVVIVTNMYIQVCLRGNQSDPQGIGNEWNLVIRERGIAYIVVRGVSLDGANKYNYVYQIVSGEYLTVYTSATSGTDVIDTGIVLPTHSNYPLVVHRGSGGDSVSRSAITYVMVGVIRT